MYLKALEIQGFKSFPDKTLLQFGDDITAIVGPNGSGKSNISDAISWVLGEQSTKALRGAKMEDVIFGGTLKRAQVGFAEASLILDNSDGALRIETAEVMVTRRYYRSGESEYYINKQSARLRDINELFMDTGLGREGYSNIGQGRIDEILSLKSTDRREVFEEAAGISKFRHRKEETERRLANTEDNLLRIGDKISELELQVEPLREQADKAQKYLALREELRGLEITVWLDSLEKLAARAKKAEEDFGAAAFILEQAHSNLNELYHTAEQLGFELHDSDLKADSIRENITNLEREVHARQSEIAVLEAGVENQLQNIERIRQELREQEDRSGGISQQIQQGQERIELLSQRQSEISARLQEIQQQSLELSKSAEGASRELAQLQARQTDAAAVCSARQMELSALEVSLEEQDGRVKALQAQHTEAQVKLQEALEGQKDCKKRLEEAYDGVTSANNAIAGYQLRLEARAAKRDGLQKEITALGVELDTVESKIKLYRDMEREYEGYSKSVRVVMQEAGRGVLKNIHGPVSKLIQAQDECALAIETALGAAMQNVVVSSEEDAKAAIQLLKRQDAGRATFLPIRTMQGRRLQEHGVESTTGFVGIAADLISYDRRYDAIFQYLLGRTVVVETLDHAITMARKYTNRFRIVTLDGQVINSGGSMSGGSAVRGAGLLSRANELKRLERRRAELAEKKQTQEQAFTEADRSAAEVEFQMTTVQGQLRQAEDEALRLEGTAKQFDLLVEAAQTQSDACQRELDDIAQRNADALERRIQLGGEIGELEASVAALEAEIGQRLAGQSDLDHRNADIQEQITAVKMESAACEAERATAMESLGQLRALEQDLRGDYATKEALVSKCEAEIEDLKKNIREKEAAADALQTQLEQTRATLQDALSQRSQVEARKTRAEKDAVDKNKDILQMERESARLEQQKAAAAMEEKQLLDKLWDTYELTPSTAVPERVEVESMAEANRQISTLKRKISALGTPNLGAIDEFARVNERYEYLSGQRNDVLQSKDDLEEIIRSITKEMTEIFVREFGRINEYFGKTFVEMFGGGKATLELDDPEEPLTTGIEIRVQPPGKQVKTITLLSGGEKAFVAIALYFAILRVRPTPFCLLDEIDAALDDNNVRRFASYLRNLCDKTQFIVITHRRGTMEEADVLYGVTMQEQGVSKILHIDMSQMVQQLGIEAN